MTRSHKSRNSFTSKSLVEVRRWNLLKSQPNLNVLNIGSQVCDPDCDPIVFKNWFFSFSVSLKFENVNMLVIYWMNLALCPDEEKKKSKRRFSK